MRAVLLVVFSLMLLSACGLTVPTKAEQPLPPPMKREVVVERIECPVPEAPLPDIPAAQTCDVALIEEQRLNGVVAQLGERIKGLWDCIHKHNKRAK